MASIKSSIQLFDNASPALRSMSNALNVVINSFESMQKSCSSGVDFSSIKLARDELIKVESNVNDIENQIENAKHQQDNFNRSISNGVSSSNSLKSSFMKIAAMIGGVIGLNQITKASDEMVSISSRLNMIKAEGETVAEVQDKIFQSAQRSRGSYQDTADAIGKMGIMAKDSFKGTDELVLFMEQVNKHFVIAGTSAEGQKAAMLQLTQAMGSGVLRGEELNSVFEQAPTIIQSIADYLGEPIGKIRDLAKEGQLTSDIVKNALLFGADEVNAKFENMPKTFGQIKTAMANEAQKAFQPVLQQLNKVLTNTKITEFISRIRSGIVDIASLTLEAFNLLASMGNFVMENWSYIAPVIGAVTTALLLYKGAAIVTATANSILATTSAVKAAAMAMESGATFGATAAQYGFNAALYACPITWIIAGILAVIAVVYLLCEWIAKASGVANSGFGVITGSVATMAAVIVNIVIGLVNGIIETLNALIYPFASIIEWIVNCFSGGFDGIGGAFLNLLGKMVNLLLSFGKVFTSIIDTIFGTKWSDGIENLQNQIDQWGKSDKAKTWKAEIPTLDYRMDYSDTFNAGAEWGDGITDKISNLFGGKTNTDDLTQMIGEQPNYNDLLEKIKIDAMDTSINTDRLADSVDWLDEDIRYLVDIAEREAINQFTTAEIKVETTNNNQINNEADLDSLLTKFNEGLSEILQTAAEGV